MFLSLSTRVSTRYIPFTNIYFSTFTDIITQSSISRKLLSPGSLASRILLWDPSGSFSIISALPKAVIATAVSKSAALLFLLSIIIETLGSVFILEKFTG